MSFLNFKMLAHPLNWITLAIWLMFIAIASVHLGIGAGSKTPS